MERVVIDASVFAKLFLPEPESEAASRLLDPAGSYGRTRKYSSELLLAECGNVLWKSVRRGRLQSHVAGEHVSSMGDYRIHYLPLADILNRSFELACELDVTTYDATYVAISEKITAPLVTADEKLQRKALRGGYDVRLLSQVTG